MCNVATFIEDLKILSLDSNLTDNQVEEIGIKYVHANFSLHDSFHKPIPFCKTRDGLNVYFKGSTYHILKRNRGGLCRELEKERIERLHWVIPTIEEKVKRVILKKDSLGKDLGERFIPKTKYRIYWIPKYLYMVVLTFDKNGNLLFNTAYPVTEGSTRKMLKRIFLLHRK